MLSVKTDELAGNFFTPALAMEVIVSKMKGSCFLIFETFIITYHNDEIKAHGLVNIGIGK